MTPPGALPFHPRRWCDLPGLLPYAALLARFDEPHGAWPEVDDLQARLGTEVRFVPARGRMPLGLDESDLSGSYMASCAEGIVPTRAGNLHDFLNALTWARFPRAKLALSRRQVEVARARGRQTNRLRTPAQDLLAMVDEGGVLVVPHEAVCIFGHGLLEDEVRGRVSRGHRVEVPALCDDAVAEIVAGLPLPAARV